LVLSSRVKQAFEDGTDRVRSIYTAKHPIGAKKGTGIPTVRKEWKEIAFHDCRSVTGGIAMTTTIIMEQIR
jgi:hypothetical protein